MIKPIFDNFPLRFEPFPYAVGSSVFAQDDYDALLKEFPDASHFKNRRLLKFGSDPAQFRRFLRGAPRWNALWRYSQSIQFLDDVQAYFNTRGLEIPINDIRYFIPGYGHGIREAIRQRLSLPRLLGIKRKLRPVVSLEFSQLAQGASQDAHTDGLKKIASFIFYFPPPTWDSERGGTTIYSTQWAANNPDDGGQHYQGITKVVEAPYRPNSGALIVKTFNSWHAVETIPEVSDPTLMRQCALLIIYWPVI